MIEVALRAARAIGAGLYGVDLKESGDEIAVIEVNDNPNLDHGVEDLVGKDEIWSRHAAVVHQAHRRVTRAPLSARCRRR